MAEKTRPFRSKDRFRIFSDIFDYKATVARGMEEILTEELKKLDARNIRPGRGVVEFSGSREILYTANIALRTAMRIVMPLFTFRARDEDQFYDRVTTYPWETILGLRDLLAVDAATNSKYFRHSMYISRLTKDAIVDRFRDRTGQRPSVDPDRPDFRFHVHIDDDLCTISLDSSGEPLYKRGYRKHDSEAPLKETLGAALVMLSGWDGSGTFVDPMCGSGTLPIEAALIAMNRAPGISRKFFGFMKWRDYNRALHQTVQDNLRSREKEMTGRIFAGELSHESLTAARENAKFAGVDSKIEFYRADFFASGPPDALPGILLMNPPYDERIKLEDQDAFYESIGDTLKDRYAGYDAWVFSGALKGLKKIGLKADKKYHLFNGAIESQLCRYKMIPRSEQTNHN